MYDILDADDLRETANYIERLCDAPDNASGAELTECSARLCREINSATVQSPRA